MLKRKYLVTAVAASLAAAGTAQANFLELTSPNAQPGGSSAVFASEIVNTSDIDIELGKFEVALLDTDGSTAIDLGDATKDDFVITVEITGGAVFSDTDVAITCNDGGTNEIALNAVAGESKVTLDPATLDATCDTGVEAKVIINGLEFAQLAGSATAQTLEVSISSENNDDGNAATLSDFSASQEIISFEDGFDGTLATASKDAATIDAPDFETVDGDAAFTLGTISLELDGLSLGTTGAENTNDFATDDPEDAFGTLTIDGSTDGLQRAYLRAASTDCTVSAPGIVATIGGSALEFDLSKNNLDTIINSGPLNICLVPNGELQASTYEASFTAGAADAGTDGVVGTADDGNSWDYGVVASADLLELVRDDGLTGPIEIWNVPPAGAPDAARIRVYYDAPADPDADPKPVVFNLFEPEDGAKVCDNVVVTNLMPGQAKAVFSENLETLGCDSWEGRAYGTVSAGFSELRVQPLIRDSDGTLVPFSDIDGK